MAYIYVCQPCFQEKHDQCEIKQVADTGDTGFCYCNVQDHDLKKALQAAHVRNES